jgi:3D (Asp-Asp-Asp) domain-containing protein
MRLRKAISACALAAALFIGGQATASAATSDTNSVVDYMKSVGKDSSFANREKLAINNNINPYIGSAYQNVKLLSILRGSNPTPVKESTVAPQKQAQPQGKTITVKATAYTAFCAGCSGVTATGLNLRTNPNQKVIAVDPNVIPLGSRVHVEGYGEAIAGDTGGAIKGNRIDIFIPNYARAVDFGIKTLNVTILD